MHRPSPQPFNNTIETDSTSIEPRTSVRWSSMLVLRRGRKISGRQSAARWACDHFSKVLIFAGLAFALAAAPATTPSSGPTPKGANASLISGDLTFTPPGESDGWQVVGHRPDGRMIAFARTGDDVAVKAVLAINADAQPQQLRDSDSMPISQMIAKRILDGAKNGVEIIDPPKVEKDDRFFLRIHHRFRKGGKVGDELQLFRTFGLNLVSVAVTAYTDKPDDAKPIFAVAEQIMLSIKSSKAANAPAKSSAITLADRAIHVHNLTVKPPAGWKVETLDDKPAGIIARFTDPADTSNLIALSIRQLPAEAKKDPKLRDALIDEIVAGEKTEFTIAGTKQTGSPSEIVDRRFLRKTKTKLESPDSRFDISSRQLRIGDQIISVIVVTLDDQYAQIDKAADEVALGIRASGKE